jgi:hypothetical protein
MKKDEMEAEIIGALIGDGYISLACGKYDVGFTGHPKNDVEYYKYLSSLIKIVWDKSPVAAIRLRGLRMKIYSKKVCEYLIGDVGLCFGEDKSLHVIIPTYLLFDWRLIRFVIRGIVDTDGSVFYSKKPGVEKYPSIEISTDSVALAGQLRASLIGQGFRVANIRRYLSKRSKHWTYKVGLYGKKNLQKWVEEIGFSNPVKLAKANALLGDH